MKTFQEFKIGKKRQLINLSEFPVEGLKSEDIIKIAQKYPGAVWDSHRTDFEYLGRYITISRLETDEEMEKRLWAYYGEYKTKIEEKMRADEKIKQIREQIEEVERNIAKLYDELEDLIGF